ncbi:MAG TPA: hypothetical protein DCS67_00155 [Clostridiales bacterium UBA8960]|nr:hypothetical protein [Clostridiales bacterium UBA8960]
MLKKTKLFIGLFFMVIMLNVSFASERTIIFEDAHGYRSSELYEKAVELVNRYKYLLELEVIGESEDLKPIYAIRMTANIYGYDALDYVNKSHLLIDGGVHGRETFNPVAVLRMIEDYVLDYYNDDHLSGYNVRHLLQTSVMHFIPIGNPDGFDIAKYGTQSINDPLLRERILELIPNLRNHRLKANVNGVDINRNFEDVYFDAKTETWISQWGGNSMYRDVESPGEDYFKGYYEASESETKAMMSYMLRYDFRAYLTFHSMGQVIYYWMDHLGQGFFELNTRFAELVSHVTSYRLMKPDRYFEYGYSTHYFSNNTLKPAMTIETTSTFEFPTPLSHYYHDYNIHKLWAVPLAVLNETKKVGYYDYKVYADGIYVRDFPSLEVAKAFAVKLGGEVHAYVGPPSYRIAKQVGVKVKNQFLLTQNLMASDGRVYVSFRELFEMLAYEISWVKESGMAVAEKQDESLGINVNTYEGAYLVNEQLKALTFEPKPILVEGRLMVPMSFMTSFLNLDPSDITIIDRGQLVYKDF